MPDSVIFTVPFNGSLAFSNVTDVLSPDSGSVPDTDPSSATEILVLLAAGEISLILTVKVSCPCRRYPP